MISKIPDISEFQGVVDIQAMINDGAPGIFVRAGYGTATGIQKDSQFDANWSKAKQTGKPHFAYVYAYPGRSSGAVHARGLAAIVGRLDANEGLMLDIEDDPTYGRSIIASDDAWAADFVNTARDILGAISIGYMNTSLKHRFTWAALRGTNSALMEANYGPNDGNSHGFPDPAPWANSALHQYTSQGTVGGRHPIDLSEFDGDAAGFSRLALQSTGPVPAPAPTPAPVGGNGTSYVVNKDLPGFYTAANAAAHTDQRTTVGAGTYFVYNQAAGMINVSRVQGVPGSWINPGDNAGVPTPSPAPAPSGHFTVAKPIPGFYTAADAAGHANQANTVQPGDYFVFNTYNGMVNVTSRAGVPGSWINPSDNSGGGTNSGNSDGGSTFRLGHTVPGFVNAGDAAAGRNSNSQVPAGTYAVFNRAQGMVNITRTAGVPGWWINPAS